MDYTRVVELFHLGTKVSDISKETGIAAATIYRYLKKNNLQVRSYRRAPTEHTDEIIHLYRCGIGARIICRHFGLSDNRRLAIYNIIRANDVEVRAKNSPLDKDVVGEIKRLYEEGMSGGAISRELNIPLSTTKKYIRKQCDVRTRRRKSIRNKRERDLLFMEQYEFFEKLAIRQWRKTSYLKIPLEEFKQIAFLSGLRAAELWDSNKKASFKTYAKVWVIMAFKKLYSQNKRTERFNDNWFHHTKMY